MTDTLEDGGVHLGCNVCNYPLVHLIRLIVFLHCLFHSHTCAPVCPSPVQCPSPEEWQGAAPAPGCPLITGLSPDPL